MDLSYVWICPVLCPPPSDVWNCLSGNG